MNRLSWWPASRRLFRRPLFGAVLAAALLAPACSGGDAAPSAAASPTDAAAAPLADLPSRPFAMGITAIPADLSEDAYLRLFDTAEAFGDLLMIQRAVPWAELAPGATLSPQSEATITQERALLDAHGLQLLFAIDPWQPTDRGQLVGNAPGNGFADPAVADAYLVYVDLVVQRYRPQWLALAVDVDQFARARPDDLEAFIAVYDRAYAQVKEQSPDTKVFVLFQLEDLQGLLPWSVHAPQFALLLRFAERVDLLAVSSFPSFIYPFGPEIPPEYFSRLAIFRKPLALVPAGFASEPGRGGVTFGTPSGQQQFVERIVGEAEEQKWALLVWLAPQDLAYADAPPYDLVGRMGLRDRRGEAKPALDSWEQAAQRPWRPEEPAFPPLTQGSAPTGVEPGEIPAASDDRGESENGGDTAADGSDNTP